MMRVVSDNSPLNILVRVHAADVLPALFGGVAIPSQVADEMRHPNAPEAIRRFIDQPPDWLAVIEPTSLPSIPGLDIGESAAIGLAEQIDADLLLIDERAARSRALARGRRVAGAIGVLERAADRDLIDDLARVYAAIRQTDFHVSEAILVRSLREYQRRRSRND